ncbi:Broad-Complex, Tramtrack and Bric a brac [Desmophyllum pertusum]|uniref:Broad-Complex, Tramtrack and Bric a brac n=1 Tax=Desmophyllum pertusum TaxID=174260 RepID=A0A9W9YV91_9CNID|nr:Broad-Complex, Tramtrack and Bric a brac [Desmophyllum pertusum]
MAKNSEVESPDFSQPWKLSDVVLVAEEERFHVHRAILAFWSPVFEKMFTTEFQEKDKNEIPLPGKQASEIKVMLRLIYPSMTEKAITLENCYFLVKLAHEYQMDAIVKRCEDFMSDKVKVKPKDKVLAELVFAQTYNLEKLKLASVDQAYSLSLDQLKTDTMYDQIQPDTLKGIMEGIIRRLQRELGEAQQFTRSVKTKCLSDIMQVVKGLVLHAAPKKTVSYGTLYDTDGYLAALQKDTQGHCCKGSTFTICSGLSGISGYLKSIKQQLDRLL